MANESASHRPCIVAVAGGKGGVGKTVLTGAIGLTLSKIGIKTILVDADLGGPNLHQVLGLTLPSSTLCDYFNNRVPHLNRLVERTIFPNLSLIFGSPHAIGLANIKFYLKNRLIRQLRYLKSDYIILDIGAGSAYNELDLFIQADLGIVVITPEPLAIQNGYHFIRHCLMRRMVRQFHDKPEIQEIIRANIDRGDTSIETTLTSISMKAREIANDDVHDDLETAIKCFQPHIIINMMEMKKDYYEGMAAIIAANDILGLQIEHLYHVHRDDWLRRSVNKGQLHEIFSKKDGAAYEIWKIVNQLFFDRELITPTFESAGTLANMATFQIEENEVICSVRCEKWEECAMRRGGIHVESKFI
ncbi:P-loop NTPase [candidate division KSB1 bacterium]|nr:P-loop NTPase [candidate division KSB1 bacterium]